MVFLFIALIRFFFKNAVFKVVFEINDTLCDLSDTSYNLTIIAANKKEY